MRFTPRLFLLGVLLTMLCAGTASAQYMKITTDNPTDNTRLRPSGTTILTITLDTTHDRDGTVQTCNSHSAANCGVTPGSAPLALFSYQIYLKTVGGTVTWGTFVPDSAEFTSLQPQIQDTRDVQFTFARPPGTTTAPGFSSLGKIPVTIVSGTPRIDVGRFPNTTLDLSSFGTSFGTLCDAFALGNTYILGDIADPCGQISGLPPDWYDADGTSDLVGDTHPPVLAQPSNMTVSEGEIANQTLTATDADGEGIAFVGVSAPSFVHVSTVTAGVGTATGMIFLNPGPGTAGNYSATVRATDGTANDDKTLSVTVTARIDHPVALDAVPNLSVSAGLIAEHFFGATDPDEDPITFTSSGPAFMTLEVNPQIGTRRGAIIHLAPPVGTSGTFAATVQASANGTSATQSFSITVTEAPSTFQANVFLTGANRVIRLSPTRKAWCAELEPASPAFQVSDIDLSSITASFGGGSIHATEVKAITDHGVPRLAACFARGDLRTLFGSLPDGSQTVSLLIGGDLTPSGSFTANAAVVVVKGGGFGKANPNPSNPSTTISFELHQAGQVRLRIYDVSGRLVNTVVDRAMGTGPQEVTWDGVKRDGSSVSSGVYYYVLETPERVVKERLVIAK